MGHRANLLLVDSKGYDLFYSHWCAITLPYDLFWGPDYAITFVCLQNQQTTDGWLDTVWAEGGAVVDVDRKQLLFFGGESILYHVPLRRVYLQLQQQTWPDWTVNWAFEGIVDLAEYVGVEREIVLSERDDEDQITRLDPPEERDWIQCVGTFQIQGNILHFPLSGLLEDYLMAGPQLLDDCQNQKAYSQFRYADWTTEFPTGGFHVDADQKIISFWNATDCPGLFNQVKAKWPDWNVNWEKDRFESQSELSHDSLIFHVPETDLLLSELEEMLLADHQPFDIVKLADRLAEDNSTVQINPLALRDDHLTLDKRKRSQILQSALAAFRAAEH